MEWLQSIFGEGNGSAMQLVIMTLALVAVVALVVWMFRWLAGFSSKRASRGSKPRLSVTDVAAVDDKRHLVLVRRDNVEHLVLVGGGSDVLIESGIEMANVPQHQPETSDSSQPIVSEQDDTNASTEKGSHVAAASMSAGAAAGTASSEAHAPEASSEMFSSDAKDIKSVLLEQNEADGPQVNEDKPSPVHAEAVADAGQHDQQKPDASKDASPSVDDILEQLRQADKK